MDGFNKALDHLEAHLASGVEAAVLARLAHTSEHHFRRMFATLAGMGLSEYVRRRRMTVAATEVVAAESTLLAIALRWGYASGDSFARAFRDVHGIGPEDARRPGAVLRSQSRLEFHLTTRGAHRMDYRIVSTPALRLVGRSTRLALVHEGDNLQLREFVASVPVADTVALKALNDVEPRGVLAVCTDFDDGRAEGSDFTYLYGVATIGPTPTGADVIDVGAATWAVFRPEDSSDAALQALWPRIFTEWLPANGWRLGPGPEIVSMQVDDDGSLTRELWICVAADA